MRIHIEKPKRPSARASDAVWKRYFENLEKAQKAEKAAKAVLTPTKQRAAKKRTTRGKRR